MKFRVVSPRETIVKYAMVEVFAILFFLLVLRNLTPYRIFSVMQTLQYALLGVVILFILLPVGVELFGFGALRFHLTKRGIVYQNRKLKYRLAWDEVQHIVLAPDLYGRISKRSYLVFYADEQPTNACTTGWRTFAESGRESKFFSASGIALGSLRVAMVLSSGDLRQHEEYLPGRKRTRVHFRFFNTPCSRSISRMVLSDSPFCWARMPDISCSE